MTDVLVYGATSAGVCAAVAAAEAGARVQLIEPGRHVGGMTSGGLGYTDIGDLRVLGGMAARFRQEVADHYRVPVGRFAGPEPHVAEDIYLRWLDTAGVELVFGAPLASVELGDRRIVRVLAGGGDRYQAGVYIDASYEGDLLAAAGVPYAVGREDRSRYGERWAGRQERRPGRHAMPAFISPFRDDSTGRHEGAALPQLRQPPLAPVGAGDGGVMAYGYRVCLTTAAHRIPFDRPDDYDDDYWELGRRLFRHWSRHGVEPDPRQLIGLEPNLPHGKCDGNSLGPFSLNVLDGSAWQYPQADADQRRELRGHHLRHTRGFLHFLSRDPVVPSAVRTELQRWGLPTDDFQDTDHLPHQLYVREARRMLGEYVLTEHDLIAAKPHQDVVAMGSYHLDIREVQRTWDWVPEHPLPLAMVLTEGYLSVPVPPYAIPYRALVPRRDDCQNLLAPVCVSASHVAFSSIRMEVQYSMLGHAAGLAAVLALRDGRAVQSLDVPALQVRLRAGGQVLTL